MVNIIIPSTVSAVTTDRFNLYEEYLPATFSASGLSVGEEIVFQFSPDNGQSWEDLYITNAKMCLTTKTKVRSLYSPMILRLVKPSTLQPVTVGLYRREILGTN